MSQPYIGEIRMFGGNFAPVGWAFCQGQIQAISENDALFNLIGTTYGGDGQTTFALPNLASRVPVHMGSGHVLGEVAGTESVTISVQQMPIHTHAFQASSSSGGSANPSGQTLATTAASATIYSAPQDDPTPMAAQEVQQAGGSQPHDNVQPFLAVNYIISLFGIFPSQS